MKLPLTRNLLDLDLLAMAKDTIRVSKLDAARRQLRTAISLWFNGGDPVAIHTLAFASYEVLHYISEKRDPYRRDLIFDTFTVKDEYRRYWNQKVRKEANFFKHADRDGDSVIEFNTSLSEYFIFFAILARSLCGETESDEESAFLRWMHINRPDLLLEQGKVSITNSLKAEDIEWIRTRPRSEFFDHFLQARRNVGTLNARFSLPVD
ncbi:hypothetical protein [Bradyrhizobium sp. TM233]|uniref:hypothetical protein n=1 Tax=Bradyrhizobium sp. TM233 TaxID=2599801 RepID=UPI0027D4E8D6|nr:hypothetical protein TM233_64100 [Bradyrhizobium sp. TM233]